MALIGTVPRRCVNLPPGASRALVTSFLSNKMQEGEACEEFERRFAEWLGAGYAFGASTGRSAFELALSSLGLERGMEIIFPAFTFPVMPMVAKNLGFKPVFCDVDPDTYNSGPEHVEEVVTESTGAVLATHLFGQPCPIREIADLTKSRSIRLLEDCAHACGVRVGGKQVGTFGDAGIFSFAEGKNMPCFGGGAMVTSDEEIASRARENLAKAKVPPKNLVTKKAFSIWVKWLLTRPLVFGLTGYQALRLKLARNQPLMDSAVGDELIDKFMNSKRGVSRMANIQGATGLLQLKHIDAFNRGARRNAEILTEELGDVPGIRTPRAVREDHVYVYYPITVDPGKRDDLRHYLLRRGVDTKRTDMADCSLLKPFYASEGGKEKRATSKEAALLEICVYPILSQNQMKRIARAIRTWAGLPEV